jgi:hypothetical protein
MEWVDVNDKLPEEKIYVLIFVDGYIGISRIIDDEWDCGLGNKRPMFKSKEKIQSKLDAQYWMPLPEQPSKCPYCEGDRKKCQCEV